MCVSTPPQIIGTAPAAWTASPAAACAGDLHAVDEHAVDPHATGSGCAVFPACRSGA